MDSSLGGFTEDDQARIAEEAQARARTRRTGLGFGLGTVHTEPHVGSSQIPISTYSASIESVKARERTPYVAASSSENTTQGEFPWDSGRRDTSKVDRSRSTKVPSPREVEGESLTKEREFPMIRDRDIERSRAECESKTRRRAKSRSRSRSIEREHNRSRWRSIDSERWSDRRRRTEGYLERQKRSRDSSRDRRRDSSRDRRRDSSRDRRRDSSRDRRIRIESSRNHEENQRHRIKSAREARDDRRLADSTASSGGPVVGMKPHEKETNPLSADQAKALMKKRLKEAVAGDESLKKGLKAAAGGGRTWERAEMAEAGEFFKEDEVAAKGGTASVAVEYETRIAQIRAVEDEDTTCLGEKFGKTLPASDSSGEPVECRTKKHDDAIFAPTGSLDEDGTPATDAKATSRPAGPELGVVSVAGTARSARVVSAATRARLALSGKLEEASATTKPRPSRSSSGTEKLPSAQSVADQDQTKHPLFKTLKVGDKVDARYTADDVWYSAVIVQVIHGGFEIARYKVHYSDYGNEETLSWKRIRRAAVASVESTSPKSIQPALPVTNTCEATSAPASALQTPRGVMPRRSSPEDSTASCGGIKSQRLGHEELKKTLDESTTEVINPNLLSDTSGRKLTWKEKLRAKKVDACAQPDKEATTSGGNSEKVTLVPDFQAQKREDEAKHGLDTSKWRSKVTFGIKGHDRP